jgi:hypothetical protein
MSEARCSTQTEIVQSSGDSDQFSIVAYLRIRSARLLEKTDTVSLDDLSLPPLLDDAAQAFLESLPLADQAPVASTSQPTYQPSCEGVSCFLRFTGDAFDVTNVHSAGDDIEAETRNCFCLLAGSSIETEHDRTLDHAQTCSKAMASPSTDSATSTFISPTWPTLPASTPSTRPSSPSRRQRGHAWPFASRKVAASTSRHSGDGATSTGLLYMSAR